MSERVTGTVSRWFDEKGYGFISVDGTRQSVFVHFSAIAGTGKKKLAEGQHVEFEVKDGPKGLRAVGVERVD